jgi:hypothetical protein
MALTNVAVILALDFRRSKKLRLPKLMMLLICVLLLSVFLNGTQLRSNRPEIKEEEWLERTEQQHNPRDFSNNVQLNLDRGLNIVNMLSAQHPATWIYAGRTPVEHTYLHTWADDPAEKMLFDPEDASKMQYDDTLFVSYCKIEEFTRSFLPRINATFVLITTADVMRPQGVDLLAQDITAHSHLLKWFSSDVQINTGGYEYHSRVAPFPLGLKRDMGPAHYRRPVSFFRRYFLETWYGSHQNETEFLAKKTNHIFAGHLRETIDSRKDIPSGRLLIYEEYLNQIAKSKYVLSPDGDHPDCHRHYEAIGLGAVPITELHPLLYSHLKEGPVIYNNTNWNMTELNSALPMEPTRKRVNRNMIFEEYWVEYVERVVVRPLRWWDAVQGPKATREEFAFNTTLALNIMITDPSRENRKHT